MVFFIAEIGSNWMGNVEVAKETIRAIKRTGVNCVKFQMWKQKDLYPDKPELLQYELGFDQAREINRFCGKIGMIFFCSPFYPEAVDFLEELRVPFYKIASRTSALKDNNSRLVLDSVSDTGKPVLVSLGMGGDKSELGLIFKGSKIFWLNCISDYPASVEKYKSYEKYPHDGVSDHTIGISYILSSLPMYDIIEKHVKFVDNKSPDSPFSINIQELTNFMILSKSPSLKFG